MITLMKHFIDFFDLFVYFCSKHAHYGGWRFETSFNFGVLTFFGIAFIHVALDNSIFRFPKYIPVIYAIIISICIFLRYNKARAKYDAIEFKWYVKLLYMLLFFFISPLVSLLGAAWLGIHYKC